MHTVGNRIIFCLILALSLIIAGCSSSSSSSTTQEIAFSDYVMTIHQNFIPLQPSSIIDRRFQGSIVAAYSMPTSLQNVFEKNIIVMHDMLGVFDLDTYVNESIQGIQKTWGGYQQLELSKDEVECNTKTLPALYHTFSMVRGGLGQTGQILYFMQYFFAKDKEIIIISSSTDNKNDLDALHTYKDSVHCSTGSLAP